MIQAKWVRKTALWDEMFCKPINCVQVIELSALTEVVEGLKHTTASLVAAVSMLERGGKSVKRVVASDKMFDQMVTDYKKAVREAQRLLASLGE